MRILVAGPPNTAAEYRSWIMDGFSADIDLLENLDTLESTLVSNIWDLLILDSTNDDSGVEELVRSVKMTQSSLPVIVICGNNPQDAIEVMRLGVSDYLVKPVEKERLFSSIQGILDIEQGPK